MQWALWTQPATACVVVVHEVVHGSGNVLTWDTYTLWGSELHFTSWPCNGMNWWQWSQYNGGKPLLWFPVMLYDNTCCIITTAKLLSIWEPVLHSPPGTPCLCPRIPCPLNLNSSTPYQPTPNKGCTLYICHLVHVPIALWMGGNTLPASYNLYRQHTHNSYVQFRMILKFCLGWCCLSC